MLADRARNVARQDLFPNTSVVGFYAPLSQTVCLPSWDSGMLDHAKGHPHFLSVAGDFFATAAHELTHWLDHTATLWGQTLLVDIHRALGAFVEEDESQFWRIAALDSRMRREALASYYTKVDQPGQLGDATTWSWQTSIGLEFGADGKPRPDRPIVFVRFNDRAHKRIARVPLTIASLLETSAMWAEQCIHFDVVATLPSEMKTDYASRFITVQHRELYQPELVLYSVAAHLVAGVCGTTDPSVAFALTAALSSIVLNLPATCLGALKVDAELRERFGERVDALIAIEDPGFVFLTLVRAAPRVTDGLVIEEWVDAACRQAGLPSTSEIAAEAHGAISALARDLPPGKLGERAAELLALGRTNFETRGPCPPRPPSVVTVSDASEYTLPPIVLNDDRLLVFPSRTITNPLLAVEPSLDLAERYSEWEQQFLAACRH